MSNESQTNLTFGKTYEYNLTNDLPINLHIEIGFARFIALVRRRAIMDISI